MSIILKSCLLFLPPRNMSSVERVEVHQYIAQEDIMTSLTAMLKDCLSRLLASESLSLTPPGLCSMDTSGMETQGGSSKGRKKTEKKGVGSRGGKGFAEREELLRIIEEGLCLLWNMRYSYHGGCIWKTWINLCIILVHCFYIPLLP